ncbi:MAG TPA: hypothetical protein VH374_18785 [Polyangia bacterium]|jgi:hypothetical protein|nr:hypothetical protein [Polyangia bacterium]
MRPSLAKPPSPKDAPRSWTSLLPRRNFRRALFLILILLAVLAIKRSGGLGTMFDAVAPPAPPTYQLRVTPPAQTKPAP